MAQSGGALAKNLKLADVYAISTGAMFSSGLFLLPSLAFTQAGSWIVLAYFLSALLIIPAMLSKAELASAMPRAGGVYYYLDRSMGPLVGTVGGLGTWIAIVLKSAFALVGMGAYVALFVDVDMRWIALALTVVFTLLNIFGAKETARLQRWLVYTLVGVLFLFVVAGFADISAAGFAARTREQFGAASGVGGIEGLFATVALVFVSYAGLTKVCSVAEEIEDPNRNIMLGMSLSLGTAVLLYTLVSFVLVVVSDHSVLPGDLAPIATAAEVVFDWMPGRLGVLIACAAALAAFASTANAGIMSASRYLFAMSRDQLMGARLANIGRYGTPTLGVLATGAFVALVLGTLDVMSLAKLASAFQLLLFALVNAAVIVMRESGIAAYSPARRAPLYPWLQLAGVFLSLALIVELGHGAMLFALGLVAIGTAWFFGYAKDRVVRRGALLHWFERLGRERFDDLERELRAILKETGLHDADPYDEIVGGAPVLDVDGADTFEEISHRAADALGASVPLDVTAIADEFLLSSRTGMVPVEHGAALPHFRVVGMEQPALAIVRAPEGVEIKLGAEHPSGAREVTARALFFLISPEEHPGPHLRILAKLASLLERDGFVDALVGAGSAGEVRQLLDAGEERTGTGRITAGGATEALARHLSGDFESILAVGRNGHFDAVVERARHVGELGGARVTGVHLDPADHADKPWLEVIRAVIRDGHDLVMVGADSRGRNLDSFTQHLLRKCPSAVWALRPRAEGRRSRVLAAVAAQGVGQGHELTDAAVLRIAAEIAVRDGAALDVVHAFELPRGATPEAAQALRDEETERVRAAVREHAGVHPDPEMHLLDGLATDAVEDFVRAREVDLVVMGTSGRAGMAGFFIGHTTEDVAAHIDCELLAIKPLGFVTPVRLPVTADTHRSDAGEGS